MKNIIEDLARESASSLRDGLSGDSVGGEETTQVSIEGVNYDLTVLAFWEKSDWLSYRYSISGTDEVIGKGTLYGF